jgi:hypothetical protein
LRLEKHPQSAPIERDSTLFGEGQHMLTSFSVEPTAGDFADYHGTIVDCFDAGGELVAWGFITNDAIDACFPQRRLTNAQRTLLVERNKNLLGRVIAEMYGVGEHVPWQRSGRTLPLILVMPEDLQHNGIALSKFALDVSEGLLGWSKPAEAPPLPADSILRLPRSRK